jgi:hypothetical protein
MNRQGKSYCTLFAGDSPLSDVVKAYQKWATVPKKDKKGGEIVKVNSAHTLDPASVSCYAKNLDTNWYDFTF